MQTIEDIKRKQQKTVERTQYKIDDGCRIDYKGYKMKTSFEKRTYRRPLEGNNEGRQQEKKRT